jgi:hypothetical protein
MYQKNQYTNFWKYMDKILSYFQVYGWGKIIVNLVPNNQFIVDTCCEQY